MTDSTFPGGVPTEPPPPGNGGNGPTNGGNGGTGGNGGLTADSLADLFAKGGQLTIPGIPGARFGGVKGVLGRFLNQTVSQGVAFAAGFVARDPMQPLVQDITNETWKLHPAIPLSAEAAAAAVERNAMKYADAEAEAALTGINSTRFGILEKLAGIPPNSEQLIQMVRRGVISKARMAEGLIQGNIRTEWSDELIKITDAVPSISQMVHFATRGVYGGSGGLEGTAEDLPSGLLEDARRNGLSPEDTTKYWASHWRLPSPTQLYVMLHRGLISAGTLSDALKANDYPSFWRGHLAQIAYHVPTRVDLRRMLEHGVIDEARVLKGYKDLGYTDEDAAILTQFAKELAHKTKATTTAAIDWAARAQGMAFADVHTHVKKGLPAIEAAGRLGAIGIPEEAASAAVGYWQAANP